MATGAIAATILSVRSIGWDPISPSVWKALLPDIDGDAVVANLSSDENGA